MFAWLKRLRQRWNDWCGDHDMEVAIREHLDALGYHGKSARLQNVRLVAVQRPGWLQIYRFEATVRIGADDSSLVTPRDPSENPPQTRQLYGLVRDDLRRNLSQVRVFDDPGKRRDLYVQWSDGLICLRGTHALT